jgi:hypothetical protein
MMNPLLHAAALLLPSVSQKPFGTAITKTALGVVIAPAATSA